MERYLDRSLSAKERAQDLLSRLTLEEKMAQLCCAFLMKGNPDLIRKQSPYGIGAISTLDIRRAETLEEAAEIQRESQRIVMEQSRFHIPAMFHMEGLCGAFIPGAASFPSGIGRGSAWNPELEEKLGEIVARQERAIGITQTFAPVLDITRDSRMGRQGEAYSEDPVLAALLGTAFTKGIQKEPESAKLRSEAVAKHFLGFHNSEGGIHGAVSSTTSRLLREIYGKPFQAAIREANLRGIMPCYCTIDGEPASSSKALLTGLLREEMGFDGLTVSDYSGIANVHHVQRLYESLTEAGLRCLEAGMDMELPVRAAYNDELIEWFRTGKADISCLDQAVLRVLTAKFHMGLFEHPFALTGEALQKEFFGTENFKEEMPEQKLLLQAAQESLVLLKNDGILPFNRDTLKKNTLQKDALGKDTRNKDTFNTPAKIAVIGPHADNPRSFFGGYTHISMVEAVQAAANSMAGVEDLTKETEAETETEPDTNMNTGDNANNTKKDNITSKIQYIPGTQIQSDETEEFDAILNLLKPDCKSLLTALRESLPETEILYAYGYPIAGNDERYFEEALRLVEEADLCIVTLGGKHGTGSIATMGEGVDTTDINLPECQRAFLKKAAATGKPLVGIHFNGRPISDDIADRTLNAILECWNPSEYGAEAIVSVLTGTYNPSGKLPVSVARSAGQIPIYYNHPNGSAWHQGESIGFADYVDMPHTPRYFFGHGLSYTSFAYENLTLSQKEIAPDGAIDLTFSVKNTGTTAGTEIVQFYIKDRYARAVRPVQELAGFARVTLSPGEEKQVRFHLHASQLAFLTENLPANNLCWLIEAGDVDVMIGASSADIRLTDSFRITEDKWIEGKERALWAEAALTSV